jgi:hypothetical protein
MDAWEEGRYGSAPSLSAGNEDSDLMPATWYRSSNLVREAFFLALLLTAVLSSIQAVACSVVLLRNPSLHDGMLGLALGAGLLATIAVTSAVMLCLVPMIRARVNDDRVIQSPTRTAEIQLDEDAAVERACKALVHGFAQPLTGVVAYSEMLVCTATAKDDRTRQELEGLREGTLQLQQLLQGVREALNVVPGDGGYVRLAEQVETVAIRPLPRVHVQLGEQHEARARSARSSVGLATLGRTQPAARQRE